MTTSRSRAGGRSLLREETDIEVVGECADGSAAAKEINALAPDLVFLDVQMPEADGFDVLEAVVEKMPVVVFVTAYDDSRPQGIRGARPRLSAQAVLA